MYSSFHGDNITPNKTSVEVVFVAEGTKENSLWMGKHSFPEGFSLWKSIIVTR